MINIPEIVTQDRSNACEIISEMLDNPDIHGLYPTTEAFNKLEELLNKVRIEALEWAWTDACTMLDKGEDPRQYDPDLLTLRIIKDLNPPWKYSPNTT